MNKSLVYNTIFDQIHSLLEKESYEVSSTINDLPSHIYDRLTTFLNEMNEDTIYVEIDM